jgi:hypothetical protein
MKSRHTPASGRLTRSFGIDGTDDLVVELDASGYVVFRKEPADRKLKRGEKLPERRVDVREVMKDLAGRPAKEMEAEEIIEKILAKFPIAKFEEDSPKNIVYAMKVWMLRELKRITTKEEVCLDSE